MATGTSSRSPALSNPFAALAFRAGILLQPAVLLLVQCMIDPDRPNIVLWIGTAFQVVVCGLSFLSRGSWRAPLGPSVIVLYVIAFGWLWLGKGTGNSWFSHLAQAVLLVVPLIVFALHTLSDSGAPTMRRARILAQRLATRQDWPADLAVCRSLPEVKALREAVHLDATPALMLLRNPRPQVRVAALAALEFRKEWRPGQAALVLHLAQHAEHPTVRAAAIMALGNVDDRQLIEALAEFLRDPCWEVRRSAIEALLWDTEHRWNWLRHAVRRTLADSLFQEDGALRYEGQMFTPEAVRDLTAWAAEKGILGLRAALTLGVHYSRALTEHPDEGLLRELEQQLANSHAPPALRIELARLLQNGNDLDRGLLNKLLDHANPAPLRLIAIEALLAEGENADAIAALRDLARLPNREIALATADLVQRRLGVDLGLALGQPLPPLHSRFAADVTRRVMMWAARQDRPRYSAELAASRVE